MANLERINRTETLGQFLTNIRQTKKLTLREVEQATDHQVSNAYLSQLEHGRIVKPSPNILHRLAMVYAVPYELLMQKAGYLGAAPSEQSGGHHGRAATFVDKVLTPEEESELLNYLAYLRSKSRRSTK